MFGGFRTSPLERLSIQKEFDQVSLVQPQHALLEQRCVTLILQAIPDSVPGTSAWLG